MTWTLKQELIAQHKATLRPDSHPKLEQYWLSFHPGLNRDGRRELLAGFDLLVFD